MTTAIEVELAELPPLSRTGPTLILDYLYPNNKMGIGYQVSQQCKLDASTSKALPSTSNQVMHAYLP